MPIRRVAKGTARSAAQKAAQQKAALASAAKRRKNGGSPGGSARIRVGPKVPTKSASSKVSLVPKPSSIPRSSTGKKPVIDGLSRMLDNENKARLEQLIAKLKSMSDSDLLKESNKQLAPVRAKAVKEELARRAKLKASRKSKG